jgi:hypothetical protein
MLIHDKLSDDCIFFLSINFFFFAVAYYREAEMLSTIETRVSNIVD